MRRETGVIDLSTFGCFVSHSASSRARGSATHAREVLRPQHRVRIERPRRAARGVLVELHGIEQALLPMTARRPRRSVRGTFVL